MTDASHHRRLENMYLRAPINALYEPTIRIEERSAEIAMPVKPAFFHAANALHGSVYFKALDDACFFAASSVVLEVFVLTVSFTTYLVRPVDTGRLVAKGTVVHEGKNLLLCEATVKTEDGAVVGRGNGSFMRSKIALTPEIGYAP
jgi:uncharacterized protein (TIGR00369 family)